MATSTEPTADQILANERGGRKPSSGRWLSFLALMASALLLTAGAREWRRASTPVGPVPQLSFAPLDQELGPVVAGELRKVTFRAINRDGSRPARVLGVEQHCNLQGCIFWRGDATTIPPGGEATIEVEWKGMEPGRLVQEFPVYTDCPGQMQVRLTIAGDVISGGKMPSP